MFLNHVDLEKACADRLCVFAAEGEQRCIICGRARELNERGHDRDEFLRAMMTGPIERGIAAPPKSDARPSNLAMSEPGLRSA